MTANGAVTEIGAGTETVVRIAARGDGVTDLGTFFPGSAPGDRIANGVCLPGPHRVIPPCRHFGVCGGCRLQHIDDASYAQYLIDRIEGALHEQGLALPPLEPPHLSPAFARRRASLRAERRGRQIVLGFNEHASHRIVDLRECHVLLPRLFAVLAPLRRLLGLIMPDRARATIVLTDCDQGVDVGIAGFAIDGFAAFEAINAFADGHRLARLSLDDGGGSAPHWCPIPPTVTFNQVRVGLPDSAFLQATVDGEAALVAAVRAVVGDAGRVADLFTGLGTFALALEGQVVAVEGSRDAALALAATRRVAVEHRDLFRRPLTLHELAGFDAVVLDPPRAGAREQVTELATSSVPRIAYVSCNPATFARDARTLIEGGYVLERITPVGQFRWSTHVELVAGFVRASRPAR